ncbi:hypothetical protein FB45DRAFT_870324 [Roridomyces roridus]|uniref:Uncharacterized protein n=1 Tax=Roridomyces roridus TaxID=1738132 RepID=A0AAD7BII4_9AGAR|nr:hypothetical protein FB45DRAFT_870324 [Roridomyces roridus]
MAVFWARSGLCALRWAGHDRCSARGLRSKQEHSIWRDDFKLGDGVVCDDVAGNRGMGSARREDARGLESRWTILTVSGRVGRGGKTVAGVASLSRYRLAAVQSNWKRADKRRESVGRREGRAYMLTRCGRCGLGSLRRMRCLEVKDSRIRGRDSEVEIDGMAPMAPTGRGVTGRVVAREVLGLGAWDDEKLGVSGGRRKEVGDKNDKC